VLQYSTAHEAAFDSRHMRQTWWRGSMWKRCLKFLRKGEYGITKPHKTYEYSTADRTISKAADSNTACPVIGFSKGTVRHQICSNGSGGPGYLWLIVTANLTLEANPLKRYISNHIKQCKQELIRTATFRFTTGACNQRGQHAIHDMFWKGIVIQWTKKHLLHPFWTNDDTVLK
jgi:hypothetical protein